MSFAFEHCAIAECLLIEHFITTASRQSFIIDARSIASRFVLLSLAVILHTFYPIVSLPLRLAACMACQAAASIDILY
jgi:hypothetical protein